MSEEKDKQKKDGKQLPLWLSHGTANLPDDAKELKPFQDTTHHSDSEVDAVFAGDHGIAAYAYAFKLHSKKHLDPQFFTDEPLEYMQNAHAFGTIPAVCYMVEKEKFLEELEEANPQVIQVPANNFKPSHGERLSSKPIPLKDCPREKIDSIQTPMEMGAQVIFANSDSELWDFNMEIREIDGIEGLSDEEKTKAFANLLGEFCADGRLELYNQTLNINPLNFETGEIHWNKPYLNSHSKAILEDAKQYAPEEKHDAMAIALKQAQDPNWKPSSKAKNDAPTLEDKAALAERRPDLFRPDEKSETRQV